MKKKETHKKNSLLDALAAAWEEYDKAIACAQAAYDEIMSPAWKALEEAIAAANEACEEDGEHENNAGAS